MNVTILTTAVRVIGDIFKFGNDFAKWRKEKLSKLGILYRGNWNNQGQIKNRPTHYIDMDGCYSGNGFEGMFNVCKSEDENSWEMFTIKGKRRFNIMKCKIYQIVEDEEILLATGIFKKHPKGLCWILKESATNQIPQDALLRKGLPKIA